MIIAAIFLAALAAAGAAEAATRGVNGRIVFTSAPFVGSRADIYVMNADGSSQTNLTRFEAAHDDRATWSPDGSKVAFTSNRTGDDIYVMNPDGSNPTALTNDPSSDFYPAWSPDGSEIAFTSFRIGPLSGEVFVMGADGSNPLALTNRPTFESGPAWSPDGSKIAFVTDRDGTADIYVMNADGAGQTKLTGPPGSDLSPAWSPDGTKIAFYGNPSGNDEIYVMNADGSDQRRLTNSALFDGHPAWSPDGTMIAFTSARFGGNDIWVMGADGSNPTRLTTSSASEMDPDWGPGTPEPLLTDTDPDSPANDNHPEIKGTAEPGSIVGLYTDTSCSGPPAATGSAADFASPGLTISVPDNSSTTLRATAADAYGNRSPCSTSSITYVEDSIVPETFIVTGPNGLMLDAVLEPLYITLDPTPTFTFSSNDPEATFECSVDGGPFRSCASPHATEPLTGLVHTFSVFATDRAGNVDPTPASREFLLVPACEILSQSPADSGSGCDEP